MQLISISGIYIFDYFTRKKLGMNRWVVYHSLNFSKNQVIGAFKYIFPLIVFIFFMYFVKKRVNKFLKNSTFDFIIYCGISILIIIFLLFFNQKTIKIYYFFALILLLIYILQIVKIFIRE